MLLGWASPAWLAKFAGDVEMSLQNLTAQMAAHLRARSHASNGRFCPICNKTLPPLEFPELKCPACGSDLIVRLRFLPICTVISFVSAIFVARLEVLNGWQLCTAVISASILLVGGIFVCLPFLPIKVELNKGRQPGLFPNATDIAEQSPRELHTK